MRLHHIVFILCALLVCGTVSIDAQTVKRATSGKALLPAPKSSAKKKANAEARVVKLKNAEPQQATKSEAPKKEAEGNGGTGSVSKMVSVASDADVYIRSYIDRQMRIWLQRSDYEDISRYKIRTQPLVRKAKMEDFFETAMRAYADLSLLSLGISGATLGEYDETNSTFLVSFPAYGKIALRVKSNEAKSLRDNWNNVEFLNVKFAPIKNLASGTSKIALSNITVSNPVNYKYYDWAAADNTMHEKLPATTVAIVSVDEVLPGLKEENTAKVSDADVEIPQTRSQMPFTYVLAIGNEYYSYLKPATGIKMDASYAINDAVIFKEYCTKTLGIPLKQVKLLVNATSTQMMYGLEWLIGQLKGENGDANVIVYYSGLGVSEQRTHEFFLLPTDYDSQTLLFTMSLESLYKRLSDFPLARTTVLLDVRHMAKAAEAPSKVEQSSEDEDESEVEEDDEEDSDEEDEEEEEEVKEGKGKKKDVKNKKMPAPAPAPRPSVAPSSSESSTEIDIQPYGRTVVFMSKSEGEHSGSYKEQQHGYFTYALLKSMQKSKGNISYEDLQRSIYQYLYPNGMPSTLPVHVSEEVDNWEEWVLNR